MKWSNERIVEVLTLRLALAAMRGERQPVTARVLARIEGK